MTTDTRDTHRVRVIVFVDFWNFQLTINNRVPGFRIDWKTLGPVTAQEALNVVDSNAQLAYQGMNVYGSYSETSKGDEALRHWASGTLSRFPGVQVAMIPRQRKSTGPRCPACHGEVKECPACGSDMRGSEEKGVDTRIATDMIKLAWVDNYDVAVLLSADRDFVPVVEFLSTRGIKTIHGAFPPQGAMLTQSCWGNVRIPSIMERFRLR